MDDSTVQLIKDIASSLDWSAWVTALATLVLAILTFIYVNLTRKILSAQSDPCVVLTVVHDEDRSTILQLVAKNVGTGLARDIRFDFSKHIPARAFDLTTDGAKPADEMKDGPLIDGIPALGPGECRKIGLDHRFGQRVSFRTATEFSQRLKSLKIMLLKDFYSDVPKSYPLLWPKR